MQNQTVTDQELERILTEVARQILDHGVDAVGTFGQWGCGQVCIELCPDSVSRVIDAGACRIGTPWRETPTLTNVAGFLDHTLLKPDATLADIDQICAEALEHDFASVCVNPTHVRRCAEILRGSKVAVCTVIGFPLGATTPETKAYEARRAIEDGAGEIDMVINVGLLKSRRDADVERDIKGVAQVAHRLGAKLKVILETCLLTDEEKVRGSELSKRAGADFVKTSTGFSKGGATVEDVALMRRTVGATMGVKASGGVRSPEDLRKMVEAGATRIGASASVAIVKGTSGSSGY